MDLIWFVIYAVLALLAITTVLVIINLRTVVATNDVHIVQSGKKTISYGKDQSRNVYYAWPSWVPVIGIRVSQLPVSVFDVQLLDYAAYDKGRVPFVVDILAFFRIEDSNIAAQRVSSFKELEGQLRGILQGASRSILAQSPIEEILEERAKYGQMFTDATNDQLKAWGVVNVKNVELMDIRDSAGGKNIQNIMAVKQSLIERDSRVSVAANKQAAQQAEITADREVALSKQEAEQQVGIRSALREQEVQVAAQKAQQAINDEAKGTAEKAMAITQVQKVRASQIEREVQVVTADQKKQVNVIEAEGEKQRTITTSEGLLEKAKLNAEGLRAEGEAKGAAEQAFLMAPVNTQITLAKEIGGNDGYQKYLVSIRQIDMAENVGIEQAKALAGADIKVISNIGSPTEGLKNVMDLFSMKGATQVGAALEAIANTPTGKAISEKLGLNGSNGAQA